MSNVLNQWNADRIRKLRLRLGWSVADFSRRFGCSSQLVMDWERGSQLPSSTDHIQFQQLEFFLENYSEQLARSPLAENALDKMHKDQIHHEEIETIPSKS